MQALILAGGQGSRLRPLTLVTAKSMMIVGTKPFLEYLLSLLRDNGIREIVISIGYLGGQIKKYFGNGSYWELDIEYSFEQIPLGTGGALKLAKPLLDSEFFIINGDSYLEMNYQEMLRAFKRSGYPLMMAVYQTEKANCIILDNGTLEQYCKAGLPKRFIDAGVWVANRRIFDYFPSEESFSLEEEVLLKMIALGEVKTFVSKNKFFDIGTFEGLEEFKKSRGIM